MYAKSGELGLVKRVFDEIENPDVYSWTSLLSGCMKLGDFGYACRVFDEMPKRGLAVWNAMITGFGENGCVDVAFDFFRKMHLVGVGFDHYSIACVLSLCDFELLDFGRLVHSLVIKSGFMGRSSVVNALLTMYFKCKCVADAYGVFEEGESKVLDQISFNVVIDGLVSMGREEKALLTFKDMKNLGLKPTELTFVSVISSCSSARIGTQVYSQVFKTGFEDFTSVANALMSMFSKCEEFDATILIFDRVKEKDVVSWNTMITSFAQRNMGTDAIWTYILMQREDVEPDEFTIGSLLVSSESITTVEMIQVVVMKKGLNKKIEVSNALLSTFCRCGQIHHAYQIFREMDQKNLISWNTMILGWQLSGFPAYSLKTFSELLASKLSPDVYSLSIVLSTCASISAMEQGKQIHGCIVTFGYIPETSLGNVLITLYAKCGVLDWALRVFKTMMVKDTISWNSLISAYAQHGRGMEAVHCFEVMQNAYGAKPDEATLTAVLSACSHSGLVNEGLKIFNSMSKSFGIEPGVDHFSCIVDLLGRAGYLDVTEGLVSSKHIDVDPNVWWALFSSCVAHNNLRLGEIVAGFLLETEQNDSTIYVLLSNIYANSGNWEESAKLRELMRKYQVAKQPGSSWIGS
ncbi:hypothetical protein Leryth_016194 [Lithospermum erythrorhizon]|nr:hypothetical protein Leryth_016194 [Lithospermum erythrorhizon]